jgi:hypothetical protein
VPEAVFVHNLELLYQSDPMKLLAFARTLMRFAENNQNLILKGIVKWYIKGEFFQRKPVKMRRTSDEVLRHEFAKLIDTYNRMPDRFVGIDVHRTMVALLPDPSILAPRCF